MKKRFKCTSCGLCCEKISEALKPRGDALDMFRKTFPYKVVNGRCEMYNGHKCLAYEKRPLLCNVEKVGEILKMDQDEWYKINAESCNKLIRENGYSSKYLVKNE